jgi:hypothetical protein
MNGIPAGVPDQLATLMPGEPDTRTRPIPPGDASLFTAVLRFRNGAGVRWERRPDGNPSNWPADPGPTHLRLANRRDSREYPLIQDPAEGAEAAQWRRVRSAITVVLPIPPAQPLPDRALGHSER